MGLLSILTSSDSIASLASWVALRAFVLDALWIQVFFLYRNVVACFRALISAATAWNNLPFGMRRNPWSSLVLKFRVSVYMISFELLSKFSLLPVLVALHALVIISSSA